MEAAGTSLPPPPSPLLHEERIFSKRNFLLMIPRQEVPKRVSAHAGCSFLRYRPVTPAALCPCIPRGCRTQASYPLWSHGTVLLVVCTGGRSSLRVSVQRVNTQGQEIPWPWVNTYRSSDPHVASRDKHRSAQTFMSQGRLSRILTDTTIVIP
ncbi:hypothetical protein E2C01_078768 [Portunus trituberculatus]|uniref:Uncharacterized protein n=1 Tax=Portunus trituberculatus TaxID=210409 RepID=A0A5B7INQ6_PORTR|nr:hypothetical protein [Portunus trituberculatus]